jgi:hypothetical protein
MATHNPTLEYLTTTKIGEKGQLTVPKQLREDLGLGNGAPWRSCAWEMVSFFCRNSSALNDCANK